MRAVVASAPLATAFAENNLRGSLRYENPSEYLNSEYMYTEREPPSTIGIRQSVRGMEVLLQSGMRRGVEHRRLVVAQP